MFHSEDIIYTCSRHRVRMLAAGEDGFIRYDFTTPENADRWQGVFVISIRKILEHLHRDLALDDPAVAHAESLCFRLLALLCTPPAPNTLPELQQRVSVLPSTLGQYAEKECRLAQTSPNRNLKRRYFMPVDKLHQMLHKEAKLYRMEVAVVLIMCIIIEHPITTMLRLAGNYVKKIAEDTIITVMDLKAVTCADKVLMDLFHQEQETRPPVAAVGVPERRASLSYGDLVRDLMTDMKGFLRDLNLIIRVFRDEFDKILNEERSSHLIFGNVIDVHEITSGLVGSLEDAVEVDSTNPSIGTCFEELLEVHDFYSYQSYALIILSAESRELLQKIVEDPQVRERLETGGRGFALCAQYFLPRLLLSPITHIHVYHTYVMALFDVADTVEEKNILRQVESGLNIHMVAINKTIEGTNMKDEIVMPVSSRVRRQLAIEKCNELSKQVDKWDSRDFGQFCSEFYRELADVKVGSNVRHVILFDGVMLLCKSVNSTGSVHLKLKEKLLIKKLDIVDRPDTDELKNAVELTEKNHLTVILTFGSPLDKRNWMADLVILNNKTMLDRSLDSILLELERRHPLKLPTPEQYRFSVPDSPENIVLEEKPGGVPLIKAATLLKLVERLTYHVHADLALVRSFLITYRVFCTPTELLNLLIERFNVPPPQEVYDNESGEPVPLTDAEKLAKSSIREDWKRYRKEFLQPVKFRVINVLRHWVDQHFYDFLRDPELLRTLTGFLTPIDGRPMKKWVQSVLNITERKLSQAGEEVCSSVVFSFSVSPPPVLRHVASVERYNWHPLALHPIELARQLTLLEFHIYRQVKPSEIVGSVWTKTNKEESSPNLLKAIRLTTNFTRWMQRCIVEMENLEERAATLNRLLEMCVELRALNNFNGILAVVATCSSASVHRLKATFQMVPPRLRTALEFYRELNSDHYKRYNAELKSINPPCVPFFGKYLTEVIHIEEGNKDYLPESNLINFTKRRLVADIIGEIQQYQNQPYCLIVEKNTRAFLENLDPFPGKTDNEIQDYLYDKSLEIEPRQPAKQTKFPRKFPELSLKLVKDSRKHQTSVPGTTHQIVDETRPVAILPVPVSPTRSESSIMVNGNGRIDPLDRIERCGSSASQITIVEKKDKKNKKWGSGREEPPSPRDNHSPRNDRPISVVSSGSRRPATSPRAHSSDNDVSHRYCEHERPPLLPRGPPCVEEPPPTPPRQGIVICTVAEVNHVPDSPPERPPPSPRHIDKHNRISPATTNHTSSPSSAHFSDSGAGGPYSACIGLRGGDGPAFSFPTSPRLAGVVEHAVPPPLPPRRLKPPPLPPRSQHTLSCPTQGTIYQRRYHTGTSNGPKLPPKPVVAPKT